MTKAKADKFTNRAVACGWEVKEVINELDGMRWTATVTRNDESLSCWWDNGCMLEAPIYHLGAYENRPRNLAAAMRMLEAKPDVSKAYKRIKAASKKLKVKVADALIPPTGAELNDAELGEPEPMIKYDLPFDMVNDPDSVILKELRGARLVWVNGISGSVEVAAIPRGSNYDLEDTFYLSESEDGRPYVSFMDGLGMFRAVYLDAILQVG